MNAALFQYSPDAEGKPVRERTIGWMNRCSDRF
jgi:hypothetical protein